MFPRFLLIFVAVLMHGCGTPATAGPQFDTNPAAVSDVELATESDVLFGSGVPGDTDEPFGVLVLDDPAPPILIDPILILLIENEPSDVESAIFVIEGELFDVENAVLAIEPEYEPVDERMAQVQQAEDRLDAMIVRLEQVVLEQKTEENIKLVP